MGQVSRIGVRPVWVAAVDRREAARLGLRRWLAAADDTIVVTGTAATVAALLAGPAAGADVVLLDSDSTDGTGGTHGTTSTLPADLRALSAAGRAVVVVTGAVDGRVARLAIGGGACAVLDRAAPATSVARAVRAAARGEVLLPAVLARALLAAPAAVALSPQEATAARLYACGQSLGSVARAMRLSPWTVKQYVDRARAKYREAGRPCPTKVHLYRHLVEDGLADHGRSG